MNFDRSNSTNSQESLTMLTSRFQDVDVTRSGDLELKPFMETDSDSMSDKEGLMKDSSVVSFETALDLAGFGRFHWLVLVIMGIASATDAVQVLCVSFLLPAAQCDLHLSSNLKGWLSASLFLGMMFGSYLWGTLADFVGRRQVIMLSLLMNGICGFFGSFSQDFGTLLIAQLLGGIGVGGSIPVAWTYFAEIQTESKRPAQMCYLSLFWMLGNMLVAGLGWIIIPHNNWGYISLSFKFNSWRIFMMTCSFVALTSSVLVLLLPESPLYLLKKGQERKALKVLRQIYKKNNPKKWQTTPYPVSSLVVDVIDFRKFQPAKNCIHSTVGVIKILFRKITYLFKKEYLRATSILLIFNFCLAFSFYGLWMWFPEMFHRLSVFEDTHNGTDTNVCDIPYIEKDDLTEVCKPNVDTSVFSDSFILAIASLPSNILTIWLMFKMRRFFLCGGMVLTGLSVFLIWTVTNRTHSVLLSALFGALSCLPYNALGVITPELYPTHVRATALGVFLVLARIGAIFGNLALGGMIDSHCSIPILLIASLLIASGLLALGLPKVNKMGS